MIGGLFHPGDGPLHRASPAAKLALLPLAGTLLFLVHSPFLAVIALLAVVAAYVLARLPARVLGRQLRGIALVVVLVALAQTWFAGVEAALLSSARLAALLLLAALVTATTRTAEIVAVLERWLAVLRPIGVDPGRVGFAIALTLRFIPLVAQVVAEIREAQAARGIQANVLRLAVPVIVRLLKTADEVAEAVDARS